VGHPGYGELKKKLDAWAIRSDNQGLHAGQIPLALDSLVNGIVLEPSAF
jgi:hypothetical protein